MVQGLAFLSKKSWHTKNLANQERVWIAEERQKNEDRKTKELARQIQQEREQDELDKITGGHQRLDRGIDWMYQGQNAQSEIAKEDAAKQAEEYLLGKEFHGTASNTTTVKGDLALADQEYEGVNKVLAASAANPPPSESQPNFAMEPTVAERNEAFRVRYEDPMFAVSLAAVQTKRKMERKKELYERVTGGIAVDQIKSNSHSINIIKNTVEADRKMKPKKKKSKKEHRRRRHRSRREYSSSSDHSSHSSNDNETRSNDSQDREQDSYKRHYPRKHHDQSRSRNRSRSRSRSRSSSPRAARTSKRHRHDDSRDVRRKSDRKRFGKDETIDTRHGNYSSRYARDRSLDRAEQYRRRGAYTSDFDNEERRPGASESTKYEKNRQFDDDYNSHVQQRRFNDDRGAGRRDTDIEPLNTPKSVGYGLQNAASSINAHQRNFGPNEDLLRRKREEKEAEKRRIREQASTRRALTPQERAAALNEMQSNAVIREKAAATSSKQDRGAVDDDESIKPASFLQEVAAKTHGVLNEGLSMAERISQNRHKQQKRYHDSFL